MREMHSGERTRSKHTYQQRQRGKKQTIRQSSYSFYSVPHQYENSEEKKIQTHKHKQKERQRSKDRPREREKAGKDFMFLLFYYLLEQRTWAKRRERDKHIHTQRQRGKDHKKEQGISRDIILLLSFAITTKNMSIAKRKRDTDRDTQRQRGKDKHHMTEQRLSIERTHSPLLSHSNREHKHSNISAQPLSSPSILSLKLTMASSPSHRLSFPLLSPLGLSGTG